jgi:hypothetical protein
LLHDNAGGYGLARRLLNAAEEVTRLLQRSLCRCVRSLQRVPEGGVLRVG